MALTGRLAAVAGMVPKGEVVADIGSDHARLPIELILSGAVPRAIAGEVTPGPWQSACRAVKQAGLADAIDVRLGDGLQVLQVGEAHTAVIAGMGGGTIVQILSESPAIANSLSQLVLQPMTDAFFLRSWLCENGWSLWQEILVQERGHLYVVLAARQGQQEWEEKLLRVGPLLWKGQDALLPAYLRQLCEKQRQLIEGLAKSCSETSQERRIREKKILEELEALSCRLPVSPL